jgi:hypothetical protein
MPISLVFLGAVEIHNQKRPAKIWRMPFVEMNTDEGKTPDRVIKKTEEI